MKSRRFLDIVAKILLAIFLIAGICLLWVFSLPYGNASHLADRLASDGKLESFTLERFERIAIPFRVVGIVFLAWSVLGLAFWKTTQQLVYRTLGSLSTGAGLLFRDAKPFFMDLRWRSQSNIDRICLVGFTLLSILPRVSVMDTLFMHDESYTYIAFASGSLWQSISDYHLPNNHVFFSMILNLTARLIGNQQWMLRVPTVMIGTLMVPVMYLFTKKLYDRETAILASTLVALFPEFIQRSTSARGYILLALIALMVAGLAAYVRTKRNQFAWWLIAILSALGFFTIPIMLFPFGGIFLWLFLCWAAADFGSGYSNRWDFFRHWFAAGLGTGILSICLYSPILLTDPDSLLHNNFIAPMKASTFLSIFQGRLINTWILWMKNIPLWLVFALVAGLGFGLLFHWRYADHKIPTSIAFVGWIALVAMFLRPDTEPRMWSIMLAFVLVWCAFGITVPLKWLTGRLSMSLRQSVLMSIMFCAFAVQNFSAASAMPVNWSKRTNLEETAAYLKGQLHEGDLVVTGITHGPMLVYQCMVRDIPSVYFLRDRPYRHAYVVVFSADETLENIVDRFGPSNPKIDPASLQLIQQHGNYQIYVSESPQ